MPVAKYDSAQNEKVVNLYAQANTPTFVTPQKYAEPAARFNPVPMVKINTFKSDAFFNPDRAVTTPMVPSQPEPVAPVAAPAPSQNADVNNPYVIHNWSALSQQKNFAQRMQGQTQANSYNYSHPTYSAAPRTQEAFDVRQMHAFNIKANDDGSGIPKSTYESLHQSLMSKPQN